MDIVSIESIAFIADGNYSSKYPRNDEFISEGVPFIRANNFENSTISDKDMLFISKEKHSTITKGHLKYNDVLITTRGNIGKTALVPKRHENSNINAQIVLLRCKENCYPKYLMHSFSIPFVKNQLDNNTTGTALKQLSVGNLRKIQIPLPPLATQKAIAEKLDKADALRKKDQELLKQYDELAQSIFIDMFGDPVQNEKGWEKNILKNCCSKIGSGSTPRGGKESYKSEGISLIRSMNVYDREFLYKDLAYIDDLQAEKLKNVRVEKGDVLFNITGASVCRCTVVPKNILPARVNQHVAILRTKFEIINNYFLNNLLISNPVKSNLLRIGSGGGAVMEAITKEQLENFEIIIPPLDLQNQFAEKIKNIEAQKELVKKQAEASENLFQALLQESFNFT